ncbi:MAG: hypothetical protein DWQ19_11060 [Crenarchaeota archaeon]|nr:MAG: hypothetical protein DWQ19_11060 [Thermoproteota archaeon]
MKVVCLCGQLQNGKTKAAAHLSEVFNWPKVSFAKKVKEIYCNTFGVDLDFVEKWKVIKEPPPGFLLPVRQSLQFIGDGFRQIDPDVWVRNCFKDNKPPMFIDDGRYFSELFKTSKEGGLNVLAWRPGWENDDPNGSEAEIRPVVDYFNSLGDFEGDTSELSFPATSLSNLPKGVPYVHYFLKNNGTLDELYEKIDRELVPFIRKKFDE